MRDVEYRRVVVGDHITWANNGPCGGIQMFVGMVTGETAGGNPKVKCLSRNAFLMKRDYITHDYVKLEPLGPFEGDSSVEEYDFDLFFHGEDDLKLVAITDGAKEHLGRHEDADHVIAPAVSLLSWIDDFGRHDMFVNTCRHEDEQ